MSYASYQGIQGWYEEPDDDDPPKRLRCTKGHFLPKDPQVLLVYPKEAEQGPYRLPYSREEMAAWKGYAMDVEWECRCGAEMADE